MSEEASVKRYRFTLSIGFPAAKRTEIVEVEGSPEDVEEAYQQWCSSFTDGGWEEVDCEVCEGDA